MKKCGGQSMPRRIRQPVKNYFLAAQQPFLAAQQPFLAAQQPFFACFFFAAQQPLAAQQPFLSFFFALHALVAAQEAAAHAADAGTVAIAEAAIADAATIDFRVLVKDDFMCNSINKGKPVARQRVGENLLLQLGRPSA
jgi:hypothetical protein